MEINTRFSLNITSLPFYSSLDVQNPTPRNPFILQMNGNGIKKGQRVKVNQLSTQGDVKVAAKLFSKWFATPVRANEQVYTSKIYDIYEQEIQI